jgi:hypothetical protein
MAEPSNISRCIAQSLVELPNKVGERNRVTRYGANPASAVAYFTIQVMKHAAD